MLPDTVQHLHERAADETRWLEELSESETNLTLVGDQPDGAVLVDQS